MEHHSLELGPVSRKLPTLPFVAAYVILGQYMMARAASIEPELRRADQLQYHIGVVVHDLGLRQRTVAAEPE